MKLLKLIVCCDANNGIGKDGILPWSIKSEMNHFKNTTIGNGNNVCVMGRKTYDSIPENHRPLCNRKNIVLTKNTDTAQNSEVSYFYNLEQFILFLESQTNLYDEYWVIGGESIYTNLLLNYQDYIQEIHVSKLKNIYDCDTFFDLHKVEKQYKLDKVHNNDDFDIYIYVNEN